MRALWIPAVVLLMSLPSAGCVKKSLYEAAVQSLTESQSRVASQEERIAALEAELGRLEAELAASAHDLARTEAERDDLEQIRQELARERDELAAESSALRKQLRASGADLEALAVDRDRTAQLLAEARSALEEARKRQAAAAARDAIFARVQQQLQSMIDAGKLSVRIERGRLVIGLKQDVLFGSGSAELSREGIETVAEVGKALADLDDRVFQVEGHTDDVPIKTARFPSNWELSSARSLSVVHVLVDAGVAPTSVSGSGYGEHQPRASNDTPDGRALNRRIEVVMLPDLQVLPDLVDSL